MQDLIPTTYKSRRELRRLENLPRNQDIPGPPPTSTFVRALERDGQITPIVIAVLTSGKEYLVAGGRRIKAARELGWTELETIVRIDVPPSVAAKWRVQDNTQRVENPIAVLKLVLKAIKEGKMVDQIADDLGLTKQTVTKIAGLAQVPEEILKGVEHGNVSVTTAYEVAKLNGQATKAVKLLEQNGRLTGEMVADLKRVKAEAAANKVAAQLPVAVLDSAVRYFVISSAGNARVFDTLSEADVLGQPVYEGRVI